MPSPPTGHSPFVAACKCLCTSHPKTALPALLLFLSILLFVFLKNGNVQPQRGNSVLTLTSDKLSSSHPDTSQVLLRPIFTKPAHPQNPGDEYSVRFTSYEEALRLRVSSDNLIILAYVDLGVFSMVINFYMTSVTRHNITNILFISSSKHMCDMFHEEHIPCYLYMEDGAAAQESLYNSKDFIRKMNIRTYMIQDALKQGYDVIHTDVDMYFFEDPQSRLKQLCSSDCDIAPLWDSGAYNAGFVYIRNTPASIKVYERMHKTADTTKKDDQTALNMALSASSKQDNLKVKRLPADEFSCGQKFFDNGHRTFVGDNPCTKCRVVHNNWIVSTEAKVYRFKEMHMWMYDENQYYSDPHTKYIQYNNSVQFPNNIWEHEERALQSALAIGQILNRTVIMPRFHCKGSKSKLLGCTILEYIKILHFDKQFQDKYRESTFLSHPLVPASVASSISPLILIQTDTYTGVDTSDTRETHRPANTAAGATQQEILDWFGDRNEAILNFHSLYNAFAHFSQPEVEDAFLLKCKKGFVRAKFHQFK